MATFEAKLLVVISDTPHQPAGFKFPRREIGKQHRSFQPIWFSKWKWLHYSESDDKVFCHTCVKAVRDFKMSSKNAEESFLTRGYNNWKAATDAFRKHESRNCILYRPLQKTSVQVCTVLKLILIMPATNATSERSFSALRRVKTYLRSSMYQQRLNHLMLLHVHKERTDALDLEEAAREFIANSEHRQRIFGAF